MAAGRSNSGTFGMRLVAGRDSAERHRSGAPRAAIVNQTFARRYLGESAIGRTITDLERVGRITPPCTHPRQRVAPFGDSAFHRPATAPYTDHRQGLAPTIATVALRACSPQQHRLQDYLRAESHAEGYP